MVARTKWRQHCSTCGRQFAPQTWAYCSKDCESARRGFAALEAREEQISEWLHPLYAERLDLRQQLEVAMPWDRVRLEEAIAANEAREAAVREQLMNDAAAPAEPILVRPLLTKDQHAFWLPILCREFDQLELLARKSLQRAITIGRRLVEARDALPHGEFGRLFQEHPNRVPGALPYRQRWAQKLMSIAANEAIAANASHATHLAKLPSDVEVCYLLSRLPAEELRAAMERGDITPETKRGDARDLLPAEEAEAEPPEPIDEIARALDPVQRALRRFAAQRPSDFGDLKARLRAALRAIDVEIAEREGSAGTELRVVAERGDMAP